MPIETSIIYRIRENMRNNGQILTNGEGARTRFQLIENKRERVLDQWTKPLENVRSISF